jgi:Zn-dependent M28 family amino/carboxypeptidase
MTLFLLTGLVLIGMLLLAGYLISRMPGQSHAGSSDPLTANDLALRARLQSHVEMLAGTIGERHMWRHDQLEQAAQYIENTLKINGLEPNSIHYQISGQTVRNIEAVIPGATNPGESIVVGAHYDTVAGTPGANDNASGVAVLLELARAYRNWAPERTLRFVAFVNEEPPFFKTAQMGSRVYAQSLQDQAVKVYGMLSLETLGYYTNAPQSQSFPLPLLRLFYPSRGNFLAFVGNLQSRKLLKDVIRDFRRAAALPSEGIIAPSWLTGIDWSDHWSFWTEGWPAVMVTDTALFRYPYYHGKQDTPEQIDYTALSRSTVGLADVLAGLAGPMSAASN